jgi:hypothetical protein
LLTISKVFIVIYILLFGKEKAPIYTQENAKKDLPLIKCECGAEILLIPDLESMSQAIENHIGEHINKAEQPATADCANQIREHLITQVFEKASKQP